MSVQGLAHFKIELFVFSLLNCKSSLYILYTSPLLDIWFAKIFSCSVSCLFTFLVVSFDAQMFLIFLKSTLSFLLLLLMLCVIFKKLLPYTRSQRFTPMFSSESFIVLALTFRSLIHFELIFVYGVQYVVCRSFSCVYPVAPSTICWKDYCFPLNGLGNLVENQLTIGIWVYFWILSSFLFIYMSILMLATHCLDYCSFEIGKSESSNFVLLL